MASSSTSWMPPAGKYPVNIGSSLGRAIKNRKLKGSPAPTTARRSNLPEREFYSFKFNFKPASVDSTKPAMLDIKKGPENSRIIAEYPSTHTGQVHPFDGTELRAKDVDCVLIYDEDTGQYTIEKVESFINLSSQRSKAASPRVAIGSPAAASTPASTDSVKGKSGSADDDADIIAQHEEEEEPEEGEEIELPPPRAVKPLPASRLSPKPPPPPPVPVPQPRAPPPAISAPEVKKPSPPPPAAKPRPQPRPKKPKAPAQVSAPAPVSTASYPNEEEFDIVRPTQRKKPSPAPTPAPKAAPVAPPVPKPPVPPASPISLSLPGSSAAVKPPPPAIPVSASAPIPAPVAAPIQIPSEPASPHMIGSDSEEDEEEWEPVTTSAPANSLPITAATNNFMKSPVATFNDSVFEEIDGDALFGDEDDGDNDAENGEGDEGEGNDEDWLAGGLNETMEEEDPDEDFIGAAVERAEDPPPRQFMSLNQYVDGGVTVHNDSDDDFTSSDESDDD